MPTRNNKPKDPLPTQAQLFNAAIKLKAGGHADLIQSTPDNQSCVSVALDVWFLCGRALAATRKERVPHDEELMDLLSKIKRPKKFPTGLDELLRCILPDKSTEERLTLYRRYIRGTQKPPASGTWLQRNLRGESQQPPTPSEEWIDQRIEADKKPSALGEKQFLAEAREFLRWLTEERAKNRSSRAKKASGQRWANKREAE